MVEDFDEGRVELKTFALVCGGCGDPSFTEEEWYQDNAGDPDSWDFGKVSFSPPRTWRRAPDWLPQILEVDPDLFGLLTEVYSVTTYEQRRLLSMGVRTALDHLMIIVLGEDIGTFEQKLDQMVERGHLTERQKDELATIIDAGSASSHRAYKPPKELLESMVMVMEDLVRHHYITGPMLKTAKLQIPPRPTRVRPKKDTEAK